MRGKWSLVAVLGAGRLLALLARMSIVPFYADLRAVYALSYTGAGALFSAFFIGYSVALVPAGLAADRWEPLRQLGAGLVALALFGTALAWAPSYGLSFAARVMEGCAVAMIFTASLKLVALRLHKAERGKAVGMMETATGLGMFTALTLFPFFNQWLPFRWLLFSVSGLCVLALMLLPLARGQELAAGGKATPSQPISGVLNRNLLFLTLTTLLGLFAINGVLAWLPTHLVDGLGYTKTGAGVVSAVVLGCQMAAVFPGGLLSDRLGRRLPVVHAGSGMLLTGFLLLLVAKGGFLIYLAAALMGLGMAWGVAPLTALTTELFGAERAGLVGAITVAAAQVGSGMAGVLFGWILDLTGRFTSVWMVAALLATLRVVTGSIIREELRHPVDGPEAATTST